VRSTSVRRARALFGVLLFTAIAAGALGVSAQAAAADSGARKQPRSAEVRARGPRPVTTFESVVLALDALRARAETDKSDKGGESATAEAPEATEAAGAEKTGRGPRRLKCLEKGEGEVPHLVAAIFRCRLRRAGWAERDVRRVAAEAVVVARCESVWDPAAVVFDGRYRDTPHPNGNRYSAAGVFQFIRTTADRWVRGGYANVTNARLNIDAAAKLYLHNHRRGYPGWSDWACVAANDGFKQGSVLPGWPGGPKRLPPWAKRY
jgi:hypothetical protein